MSHKQGRSIAYCQSVIAKDYYDGPMAGVGTRTRDDALIFFRVVGWDAEQWERIFAIAPINNSLGERLRAALVGVEKPPGDFWLPGPASNEPKISSAWQDILATALETQAWQIIEGHDLLGPVIERSLSGKDGELVAEMVRNEAVLELRETPLLDDFLRGIHAQAGV